MDGWEEDISGVRRLEDLPPNARRYVDRLSELSGVPLSFVSVGPSRDATIVVSDPFVS
jgi:adenylosuccinate synthase